MQRTEQRTWGFLVGFLVLGSELVDEPRIAGNRPECVSVSKQAVFNGSGYAHWVAVNNRCSYEVSCTVTTNVNPTPSTLRVSAGQSNSVNTFFSSPASAFSPTVNCSR